MISSQKSPLTVDRPPSLIAVYETTLKRIKSFDSFYVWYLYLVGAIGLGSIAFGIYKSFSFADPILFALMSVLIGAAAFLATSLQVTEKAGVTYDIGPVIAIASVPFFGIWGPVLLITISNIVMWLYKPSDGITWKKSWKQVFFNVGMSNISVLVACLTITQLSTLAGPQGLIWVMAWAVGAVMFTQTNIGLLMGILRLQHGKKFGIVEFWKSNLAAYAIDVTLITVGGGVLAIAITDSGYRGAAIFFLPIFLSAFAFRLYTESVANSMRKLESEVEERTRELVEVNKQKDLYLSLLTHDMKSPLTAIEAYTSLIKRKPELAQTKPHMLDNIASAQRSLREIVDNILDIESMNAQGGMPLNKTNLDLADLIESVSEMHQPVAKKKNIDLHYAFAGYEMPFEGDGFQLRRMMNNIVSNAIKYSPADTNIWVMAIDADGQYRIDIKDTGFGIPEDQIDAIFDRYQRVENHKGKATGTGLGLAICKAIVEAHGGTISVRSMVGKGSTFTIHLPYTSK